MVKPLIADKRATILNTALDLIAEHGFQGTPVSLVAKNSDVSIGIIYHYFASKDELIHALYRQIKLEFNQALLQGAPHLLPWPEYLKRVWLNAYHYYVAHPKQTIFLEQYENSPYQISWETLEVADNLKPLLERLQNDFASGLIKPMPFEVFYELTLGVAVSLARRQIAGNINLDEVLLHEIAESCFRAVKN